MKNTIEILDKIKEKHGLTTDYQLAKIMGIRQNRITMYRQKNSEMGDDTALIAARLLEMPPGEIMAICRAAAAPTSEIQSVWQQVARSLHGAAYALAIATLPGFVDHTSCILCQIPKE